MIGEEQYEQAKAVLDSIDEYWGLDIGGLLNLCKGHILYDDGDNAGARQCVHSLTPDISESEILNALEAFKEQVEEEYDVYLEEKAAAEAAAYEVRSGKRQLFAAQKMKF